MVSDIADEQGAFTSVLNAKYPQLAVDFGFCFRVLDTLSGIRSRVRFDKVDRILELDLMMPEEDFLPYKQNKTMQRLIMGRYFFPFFSDKVRGYKGKLPALSPVLEEVIVDMEAFLVEHLWLPDEDGHLRLSVIEDYTYEQTIQQFGPPSLKMFTEADGVKVQDLRWAIDAETTLSAQYKLIDRTWRLERWERL